MTSGSLCLCSAVLELRFHVCWVVVMCVSRSCCQFCHDSQQPVSYYIPFCRWQGAVNCSTCVGLW